MSEGAPRAPDGRPLWYGRRHSHKLRPGRARLLDEKLPKIRIASRDGDAAVDLAAAFGGPVADVRLEIGFGAGEHVSGEAEVNPDVAFIGCEPFVNGVASLLADIERLGLENVRIFDEDARLLLPRLPAASVGRIYILFPDPWPKVRHHRRRFMQQDTLDELARIARADAELVFASDHMGYVAWTLIETGRHPGWQWTARRPADWRDPPPGWVPTRYEAKARRQGIRPAYLVFRRSASQEPG